MTECEEVAETIYSKLNVFDIETLKQSSLPEITTIISDRFLNNEYGLITDLIVEHIVIKIRALNLHDAGLKDVT